MANETAYPLYIPLGKGRVALVSDEDYERISQQRWGFDGTYARRRKGKRKIYMHHEILPLQEGLTIDHRNGVFLDNRRENLRYATKLEQQRNQPGRCNRMLPKGVKRTNAKSERWDARIKVLGQEIHLGTFSSPELAAQAYDAAAQKYFGAFARLNNVF